MNEYVNYSREDLIKEIEMLKSNISVHDEKSYSNRMLSNMIALRKALSDVLALLLSSRGGGEIDQALLVILNFFDVDRVYIGNFEEKSNSVDFTHEVTYGNIISMREDLLRDLSEDEIPWWISKIRASQEIIVDSVPDMTAEAITEQHLLTMQEVVSLLASPVVHDGKVSGFIGLDSVRQPRKWSAIEIENLRVFSNIISIAIERERAQGMVEHSLKQVLQSEAKFRIIFDKLPWGVELYNEQGELLELNNADLEIFGTTREQAVGVNAFKNPNIPDWVNKKLKQGEDVTFALDYNFGAVSNTQYYSSTIQDQIKHLLVKGVVLKDQDNTFQGFFYIVFDNTESYRKTEEIQYNLAKLQVAVNTGESVIWEYNVATQKLNVDFGLNENNIGNEFLESIQKYHFESLQDFINTLHPEDKNRVFNQFQSLINGEVDNYISVYRRNLGDKTYWLNSNVRSYKQNEDGTPSKVVGYASNITQQREKETELIKVKEADKLKSAFLANMSHEIRTPLNAIVGFSDLVAETDEAEERRSYIDIIHKNNDLLLHLIDDILDFSRIESGTLEYKISNVDIKEICGEVYLGESLKMSPDVQLIFEKELPSIHIKTDAKRIIQVLTNFVNNAIKFTSQGSITISYKIVNSRLHVSVQDTGIGIEEKNRARIFDRFIKVNEFKQGTGLGLTISKTIIEGLGGSIGVNSVQGTGSTFWFTLPLENSCQENEIIKEKKDTYYELTQPTEFEKKTILIAEDVSENYFLLQTLLDKKYKLYHAWNGREAIELYKKVQPDLILMDLKMPEMDGFEATKRIRSLSETIPIIALTAFAFETEKQMAFDCHFTDYVVKPIDINKLREMVSHILIN